jgi:hypothetical protein
MSRTSAVLADGEVIHVGDTIATAAATTAIANNTNANTVFRADSGAGVGVSGFSDSLVGVAGASAYGTGVHGTSAHGVGVVGDSNESVGVLGTSGTTEGVRGQSAYGVGVYGLSSSGYGVAGNSGSPKIPAVLGHSVGNSTAVLGFSGATVVAAKPKTGVYGYAAQDATSVGILGQSTAGTGVRAAATTGYALVTDGRVKLGKSAGVATIASAHSSVTVTPGIDLTATSAVVATLNGSAGGSTAVKRVAVNTTTNAFTIYLTANSTVSVNVAWIVLG